MTAWFVSFLIWHFLVFCFIVILIARIADGFRQRMVEGSKKARQEPAREILRRRVALGEIAEAQYREMLAVLDAE